MIFCRQTPAPAPDTIKQEFFTLKFELPDDKQEFFDEIWHCLAPAPASGDARQEFFGPNYVRRRRPARQTYLGRKTVWHRQTPAPAPNNAKSYQKTPVYRLAAQILK